MSQTSELFQPLKMRGLDLPNRVVVAPMCQYSATDGVVGDWHLMHVGQFAVGGHGLFICEAAAVEPRGRISVACPGLWTDEQAQAWKRVIDFAKTWGNTPMAIQLAHAGRKGSSAKPWLGSHQVGAEQGGWTTVAPSAVPFDDTRPAPHPLDGEEIAQIVKAFADAAGRADAAGFDAVEIHAAHGYLLHQFLSPLSNRREDAYGGAFENRVRVLLDVFDAVRARFPADKPVGVRVSATDWVEGGWGLDDTVALAALLEARGCDFYHVSSGGLSPAQEIPLGPGYQVELAHAVTQASDMTTIAVGLIDDPRQAETIVRTGQADMVALARGMLFDPHWTWRAARELGGEVACPRQYERGLPGVRIKPDPDDPPTG